MQKEFENILQEVKNKITKSPNKECLDILLVTLTSEVSEGLANYLCDSLNKFLKNKVFCILVRGKEFDVRWVVPKGFTFEELKSYLIEQNKNITA